MKYFLVFIVLGFALGCNQVSPTAAKVIAKPYWCLSEVTNNGAIVPLKSSTGFTLYTTGKLSGSFPINGFGGQMYIDSDGKVTFTDVSWTSMAGDGERMTEESALKDLLFAVDKAQLDNEQLVMKNDRVILKYSPCDFGFMKNLQKNEWQLFGIEQQQDSDVVAIYQDAKRQYKNLTNTNLLITLQCEDAYAYDQSTNSIVYNIHGSLGKETYKAKLYVSKNNGLMYVDDITSTTKEKTYTEFLQNLGQLSHFSFIHNNLHIDTKGDTLVVLTPKK